MQISKTFDNAFDFEKFIAIEYERLGFNVKLNSKQNEPGYDFLARKKGISFAVQVKNYKRKVPVNAVLKFKDYLDQSEFKYGAIISSKGFSPAAIAAITSQNIKNIQMGYFSPKQKKIVWDYIGEITTPASPPTKKVHYISVFTATGGVGKTIVSSHLAGAFALSGYNVNIVDGDPEGNLYRLTGDTAIVPNTRLGKSMAVSVSKMSDWSNNKDHDTSITIFDCSPALERNNLELLKKTESFIIPTWLKSPLQIGNRAEVLLRTINQIRKYNEAANIFILFNNYSPLTRETKNRLRIIKNIISDKTDNKCFVIDPEEEISIRYSKLLENWGSEPDLAFKSVAGRCYPREDFLELSEYLLQRINVNQK